MYLLRGELHLSHRHALMLYASVELLRHHIPSLLLLVVLCPPLDVARHRNATRAPETRVGYDFAPLARNQQRELGDLGWWLDSGEQTPEQTAELIVAEAAQRAVVTDDAVDRLPLAGGYHPGFTAVDGDL